MGDREEAYKSLLEIFGKECISDQKGKECYRKPCACLVCRHEDWFCVDGNPCYGCEGRDGNRTFRFCVPDED